MQLHVDPPGDMTEGSLAGLRDEPLLHFFVPFSVRFWTAFALRLRVIVRKRKNLLDHELGTNPGATITGLNFHTRRRNPCVNTIPPGYDENNGYGIRAMRTNAMNYSITIKKNWNDAHNNKQLTVHNKYTNDDADFDDCVAHNMH